MPHTIKLNPYDYDIELIDLLNSLQGQKGLEDARERLLEIISDGPIKKYFQLLEEFEKLKDQYWEEENARKEVIKKQLKLLNNEFEKMFSSLINPPLFEGVSDTLFLLNRLYLAFPYVGQRGALSFEPARIDEKIKDELLKLAKIGIGPAITAVVPEMVDVDVINGIYVEGAKHGDKGSAMELSSLYLSNLSSNIASNISEEVTCIEPLTTEQDVIDTLRDALFQGDPIAISKVTNFIDNIISASGEAIGKSEKLFLNHGLPQLLVHALDIVYDISSDEEIRHIVTNIKVYNESIKTIVTSIEASGSQELQDGMEREIEHSKAHIRELQEKAKKEVECAKAYIEGYKFVLMSPDFPEDKKPEPNKIYLKKNGDQLECVLNFKGNKIIVPLCIKIEWELTKEILDNEWSRILKILSEKRYIYAQPYHQQFKLDPDRIEARHIDIINQIVIRNLEQERDKIIRTKETLDFRINVLDGYINIFKNNLEKHKRREMRNDDLIISVRAELRNLRDEIETIEESEKERAKKDSKILSRVNSLIDEFKPKKPALLEVIDKQEQIIDSTLNPHQHQRGDSVGELFFSAGNAKIITSLSTSPPTPNLPPLSISPPPSPTPTPSPTPPSPR